MRFAQLSDPHLEADDADERWGGAVNARFSAAVAAVAALSPPPAFTVITGDLVAEETEACYARLRALVRPLPGPVYFVMGNHDDPDLFRAVVGAGAGPATGRYAYTFDVPSRGGPVRFVVLDSRVAGEVSGTLGDEQLAFLDEALAVGHGHGARAAVVFVHHPPVPIGVGWMDDMRATDGPALLDRLRKSPLPVARVLCGHVHMPATVVVDGVTVTSAPSTAYHFNPLRFEAGGERGEGKVVVSAPPAFLLATFDERGLSTVTVPVEVSPPRRER